MRDLLLTAGNPWPPVQGPPAVPGLAAKPIIDFVVTVPDITAEEDYFDPLMAAGCELRVREPGHRMVRSSARDVQVHILQQGNSDFDEYPLLREQLRADADDRALYEYTKRALLAEDWNDMNAYAEVKTEVIQAIKKRAHTKARAADRVFLSSGPACEHGIELLVSN